MQPWLTQLKTALPRCDESLVLDTCQCYLGAVSLLQLWSSLVQHQLKLRFVIKGMKLCILQPSKRCYMMKQFAAKLSISS